MNEHRDKFRPNKVRQLKTAQKFKITHLKLFARASILKH